MKLVAQVVTVLRQVNKTGAFVDGEVRPVSDMPPPARVEIVPETPDGPWMMVRYTADGDECGDTWHEDLENAYGQAAFECGLAPSDFREVDFRPVPAAPAATTAPSAEAVQAILSRLCIELGFCLPVSERDRLAENPPDHVDRFAAAVFLAEGLSPETVDKNLWRQVRDVVVAGFADSDVAM